MAELNFSKDKKLILSMIQPTGTFTLGNYLGAVKNWGPFHGSLCAYDGLRP